MSYKRLPIVFGTLDVQIQVADAPNRTPRSASPYQSPLRRSPVRFRASRHILRGEVPFYLVKFDIAIYHKVKSSVLEIAVSSLYHTFCPPFTILPWVKIGWIYFKRSGDEG